MANISCFNIINTKNYCISIRKYNDSTRYISSWGKRRLGKGRYAFDLGRVAIVFEKFN